jgi:hypothetical protein
VEYGVELWGKLGRGSNEDKVTFFKYSCCQVHFAAIFKTNNINLAHIEGIPPKLMKLFQSMRLIPHYIIYVSQQKFKMYQLQFPFSAKWRFKSPVPKSLILKLITKHKLIALYFVLLLPSYLIEGNHLK